MHVNLYVRVVTDDTPSGSLLVSNVEDSVEIDIEDYDCLSKLLAKDLFVGVEEVDPYSEYNFIYTEDMTVICKLEVDPDLLMLSSMTD